jgi:hypothetical protein
MTRAESGDSLVSHDGLASRKDKKLIRWAALLIATTGVVGQPSVIGWTINADGTANRAS